MTETTHIGIHYIEVSPIAPANPIVQVETTVDETRTSEEFLVGQLLLTELLPPLTFPIEVVIDKSQVMFRVMGQMRTVTTYSSGAEAVTAFDVGDRWAIIHAFIDLAELEVVALSAQECQRLLARSERAE